MSMTKPKYVVFYNGTDTGVITDDPIALYEAGNISFIDDVVYQLGPRVKLEVKLIAEPAKRDFYDPANKE